MLASLRDSCAGSGKGWAWGGWGRAGLAPPSGAGRGRKASCPVVPWGPACQASPGMVLSHPGCFLCALKTIFALSGVRKKYSGMVEKRYLHTLVGRKGEGQSRGGGASKAPSHPQLSVWGGVGRKSPGLGGRRPQL